MKPTQIQQFLFIDISDTFTITPNQSSISHPLLLTNISQYDLIYRLRSNHAKLLTSNSSTGRIKPFQAHKYPLSIKGEITKDIVLKLQITWCKILPNTTNSSQKQHNKQGDNNVNANGNNTLFGKVDSENTGKKIISIKGVYGNNLSQPILSASSQLQQRNEQIAVDKQKVMSQQQQQTYFTKSQQSISSSLKQSSRNRQQSQVQQLIKTVNKLTQQNQQLIKRVKQLQQQLLEARNNLTNPQLSQNQQQLKDLTNEVRKLPESIISLFSSKIIQQQVDSTLQIEKRVTNITEMIRGLMKPTGLKQLLTKIQHLSINKNINTKIQQQKIKMILSDKEKQHCQKEQTNVPKFIEDLQNAFYEFASRLLKKIRQLQLVTNANLNDINNII